MAKMMLHDDAARQALGRGVAKLARAVSGTLGPRGMNAVMDRPVGTPIISRDGVSIADEIELECPFENMGAQIVREVARQTNEVAGDGTTTATVLAEAIYREGLKYVTSGANPIGIQRGIAKAVEAAVEQLAKIAKKVKDKEEIKQVATVSANWTLQGKHPIPLHPEGADLAPIYFGASDGKRSFFKGLIDEIVVYNRALSGVEIKTLAQSCALDTPK